MRQDWKIRRLRRADRDELGEILHAAGFDPFPCDRAGLRRFRNLVADLGSDVYVAARRDRVVAFVHVAYVRTLWAGNLAHLLALVVHPEERGRGMARQLLRRAERCAARRHCAELRWVPGPWAADAPEFLAAVGWNRLGSAYQVDVTGHCSQSGA